MKIKFVKEYRALKMNYCFLEGCDIYEVGAIKDMPKKDAQWLIDNGFAEQVKESSLWEPEYSKEYYYLDSRGVVTGSDWECTAFDTCRRDIGNVFKTCDAAERYREYLEAVKAVRYDEGFMKPNREIDYSPCGYGVFRGYDKKAIPEISDRAVNAGEFYFDTYEHAKDSVEAHQSEWRTILNYDWSKE